MRGGMQSLFEDFFGTMGLSDFPCSCIAALLLPDSQCVPYHYHNVRSNVGYPSSCAGSFHTCMGSSTAQGPGSTCAGVGPSVAFRAFSRRRHPGRWLISRLNTQPTCPPVNASPPPLRTSAHDSGPMRFAIPSSYGTFTHYFSPVLTGAPRL